MPDIVIRILLPWYNAGVIQNLKINLRSILLLLVIIVMLLYAYSDIDLIQMLPPPKPAIPKAAVVCPVFHFKNKPSIAFGTGFVLEAASKRYLVTAYHLLHIDNSKDLDQVKYVDLYNANRSQKVGTAGLSLLHSGRSSVDGDLSMDCALFASPQLSDSNALQLSDNDVVLGDRVWIVGKSETSPNPNYVPARVIRIRKKDTLILMRNPTNMVGYSGSPVINRNGKVFGILLMGSQDCHYGVVMRLADLKARISEIK